MLKDIAKEHQGILTDILKVQPVAAVVVAGPAPARDYRKLAPSVRINVQYMLIQLLQVSPVRALGVSGWIGHPKSAQVAYFGRIDKIQWQTHEHGYWMELTGPTFANQLAGIDRILSGVFRYRMLIGATGQGTRLLRDDLENPLPLAEMIRIRNSRHVRTSVTILLLGN